MKITRTRLEEIIRERFAAKMGRNAGQVQTYIDPHTQEVIDFLENELGTSSFFDEVMERLGQEQMKSILKDIQREYGFSVGGVEVR
jgi:hypothetical protein